jgi:beta-glucosidase
MRAAARSSKPVTVVIVAGSAVMVEEWVDQVGAVLQTFYAGMEGGTALAQLVFGDVSPSGRLPFTVARRYQDYPHFDKDADSIEYGPYHGYTLFEKEGRAPRFAFGHGMSYADFSTRALRVRRAKDTLTVQVTICNTSPHAGEEVVLCFVAPPGLHCNRPKRLLKAFDRVSLAAGERKTVTLTIDLDDLRWWDDRAAQWRLEPGRYVVTIGDGGPSAEIHL